jgi:hypothetical protein
MPSIGFRVEPTCFHWAVVDAGKEQPVLVGDDRAAAPKDYTEAQALSWYRARVLALLNQFKPERAAIRYAETMPGRGNPTAAHKRFRIEGVILEAVHSKGIDAETGALNTISSRMGSKRAKNYLERDNVRGLDFGTRPQNRREAILVAVSVLRGENGYQD